MKEREEEKGYDVTEVEIKWLNKENRNGLQELS
jgi:hypothetical protein